MFLYREVFAGKAAAGLDRTAHRVSQRGHLRALQELRELPQEAWEAELASPLVLAFRIEADRNHGMDTMQYVAHLEAIYER